MKNGKISLTNTDPKLINLFSKFLYHTLKVPKENIHPWLILYNDLSETKCKQFWSKASDLPLQQFTKKTQFIKGRHPTRKTSYGICILDVYSRGLKEQIFIWQDLLHKQYETM